MTVAGYLYGKPCCSCVLAWWPAFEALIGRSVPIIQSIGNAPASAGFHAGGGSIDCAPLSEDELRVARNCGAAAWNRWWTDNYHAHMRLNGCPHNSIGQPQVDDLNAGRDGTGPLYDNAGTPDNGPRDGVQWPLRTWREGIQWARAQEDEMRPEDWTRLEAVVKKAAAEAVDGLLNEEQKNGKTLRENIRIGANARDLAKAIADELGVKAPPKGQG